jgi:hypothetical protein
VCETVRVANESKTQCVAHFEGTWSHSAKNAPLEGSKSESVPTPLCGDILAISLTPPEAHSDSPAGFKAHWEFPS